MFAGIDLGTSAVKLLITDLQGNGGTYYGEYRENSPEGFWLAVEAVSYTHLDVYKRQPLNMP